MKSGLQVSMLGSFSLYYNGMPVQLKKKLTSKPVQLLLLLLYHREPGISRHALMEALFGQEAEIDAANTLNATVSQLRKLLRETHLPPENYIRTRFDRYYFESSFPVYIDVEEVTRLRQQADLMQGPDRQSMLYRLCDLFGGRFLPELDGEDWAEIARAHYQRIYRNSLEEICRELEKRQAYSEILRLTQLASHLFPFDEWQIWQQESLLAQGRFRDAQALYRKVEQMYLSQLDAPPPERMRARLYLTEAAPSTAPRQLEQVYAHIHELDAVAAPSCIPFPSFLDVLGLIGLTGQLSHVPLQLLLCTLTGSNVKAEQFHHQMELLQQELQDLLSPTDLFTRYSRSQFLAVIRMESAPAAALSQTLLERYNRHNGACRLTTELRPMQLPDGGK